METKWWTLLVVGGGAIAIAVWYSLKGTGEALSDWWNQVVAFFSGGLLAGASEGWTQFWDNVGAEWNNFWTTANPQAEMLNSWAGAILTM